MCTDSTPVASMKPPQTAQVLKSTPRDPQTAPVATPSQSQYNGRQWSIIDSPWHTLTQVFFKAISCIYAFLELIKKSLTRFNRHNPEAANRFGHGIRNGGNSCYINSVVQALRFVPRFMPILPASSAGAEQRQALLDLHETIEGRREGQTKRCITEAEINEFRELMMDSGFGAASSRSQEDAAEFCQFLLDQIGFPLIHLKTQVYHELGIPIPSLDNGQVSENHLELTLGNIPHNTELKDIVLSNIVTEEVVAASIKSRNDLQLTAECAKTLGALRQVEHIQTLQSTHLIEGKIPALLPIFLKRYAFDVNTQKPTKNKTRIIPSKTIDFPLVGHPTKKARFSLAAMIIHDGVTFESGHCVTYVPQMIDGREVYIEYDDSLVLLHNNPRIDKLGWTQTIADNAAINGYLYFYKFTGYTE